MKPLHYPRSLLAAALAGDSDGPLIWQQIAAYLLSDADVESGGVAD